MKVPEILLKEKSDFVQIKSDVVESNDNERTIIHYISRKEVDLQNDIVYPEGMNADKFTKTVWYNHNYTLGDTLPIGRNQWLKTKDDGVIAKTEFNDLDFSLDIYKLHKTGFINHWSVAIRPIRENGEIKKGSIEKIGDIWHWKQWHLIEYSSAPIPANVGAVDLVKSAISEVKSFEAKEILNRQLMITEITLQLKELRSEIEKIKSFMNENNINDLMDLIDNDIKHYNELKSLMDIVIKRLEPKEALDNQGLFKKLSSEIIRDAVRKTNLVK